MLFTLVTGASSGIGYELAKIFARNNHNLVLVARRLDKLTALKTELEKDYKIRVEILGSDLGEQGSAQNVFSWIQSQNFEIDILVNNAGFGSHGLFSELELSKTQEMIQLNITTLTELTRLFLPEMLRRKYGRILNVASTAAFQPGPLMTVYYATKAYVLHFSEGLFEELKGSGVTVTALCPGPTTSGFQAAADMENIPLFTMLNPPTSLEVAEYGYKAMMAGRDVSVHGVMNKIAAFSSRLVPRSVTRKLVKSLQSKRPT